LFSLILFSVVGIVLILWGDNPVAPVSLGIFGLVLSGVLRGFEQDSVGDIMAGWACGLVVIGMLAIILKPASFPTSVFRFNLAIKPYMIFIGHLALAVTFLFPMLQSQIAQTIAVAQLSQSGILVSDQYVPQHVTRFTYDDIIQLVGYDVISSSATPGGKYDVTLYWRALKPIDSDYKISVKLFSKTGKMIAQQDAQPANDTFPTSRWPASGIIRDIHRVPIPASISTPNWADIRVEVYSPYSMRALHMNESAGSQDTSATISEIRLTQTTPSEIVASPKAVLGNAIALVSAQAETVPLANGKKLRVTLEWQCLHQVDRDYVDFIHVGTNTSSPVVQKDAEPRGGDYPTSVWQPGEKIVDTCELIIPSETPKGIYQLYVGMYARQGGERLAITSGVDDQGRIPIGQITIE
jgi:hypothetical protein